MDFERIYRMYFKDVFLYLRALSADTDTAEEITQETFVKALRSIDTFDGSKDIRHGCLRSPEIHITYTAGGRPDMPMRNCPKMSRTYGLILQSSLRTKSVPFRSTVPARYGRAL